MPTLLQDPKYGDAWFGPGAAGRWITPGAAQSPLWNPNPLARYSWRGMINLFLKEQEREFGPPVGYNPPPFASGKIDMPAVVATGAPFSEIVKYDTPLVVQTGGYAQPYDFSATPQHAEGYNKMTTAEKEFVTNIGNTSELVQSPYWQRTVSGAKAAWNSWWGKGIRGLVAPVTLGGDIGRAVGIKPPLSWDIGGQTPLEWLDAGAEFLERMSGTGYQYLYDPAYREAVDRLTISGHGMWGGNTYLGRDYAGAAQDKQMMQAAWDSAHLFFESIAPPRLGIRRTSEYLSSLMPYDQTLVDLTRNLPWATEAERDAFQTTYETEWNRQMEHWGNVLRGYPTETGGLPGLVTARSRIMSGADPNVVYQEYAEGLGILYARPQWNDMVGHVLFDPLNILLPKLKPVERMMALSEMLRVGRVAPEIAGAAGEMRTVLSTLQDASTRVARYGDEFLEGGVLTEAGRTTIADDLIDLARKAGTVPGIEAPIPIDPLAGVAERLAGAVRSGGDLTEPLAEMVTVLDRLDGMKHMNTLETLFWRASGGDPFNPTKLADQEGVWAKLNWLRLPRNWLTPASRANLMGTQMFDNLRLFLRNGNDPVEWIRFIKQAAAGAFGDEFGHMLVSPVGRHLQGILRGWDEAGSKMIEGWVASKPFREFAEAIAFHTQQPIGKLMDVLINSPDEAQGLLDNLANILRQSDSVGAKSLLQNLDSGAISADTLREIGNVFKPINGRLVPYTPDMFRAVLTLDLGEQIATAAKLQFGVTERGFFGKVLQNVKAAEGLMLLGLNPKYPVQNVMNNELTMLARGLMNGLSLDDARKVFSETFDFTPFRAGEGFGIFGDIDELIKLGSTDPARKLFLQALQDTVEGKPGYVRRVLERINKAIPDPINMRRIAGELESFSSMRAHATGMLKAWDEYAWRPGYGFSHIDDVVPGMSEELRVMDPDAAQYLEDFIQSSTRTSQIDTLLEKADLRLTPLALFREAAGSLGMTPEDARMFVDHELFHRFVRSLDELGPAPSRDQISKLFHDTRTLARQAIDERYIENLAIKNQEFAARATAGGTNEMLALHYEVIDKVMQRQFDHIKLIEQSFDNIRNAPNSMRNALFESMFAEGERAWRSTWDFWDAAHGGMRKGWDALEESGVPGVRALGDRFTEASTQFRKVNTDYITLRNTLWKEFSAQIPELRKTPGAFYERLAAIHAELDTGYQKLTDQNVLLWKKMDEMFIGLVGDNNSGMRDAVREWRRILRGMRQTDMRDLLAFRQQVRGTGDSGVAWTDFWKRRGVNHHVPVVQMEKYGKEIFAGNEEALMQFQLFSKLPDDFTDIRMVDLLSSTLSDNQIAEALVNIPGGQQLLGMIGTEGFGKLRDVLRTDEFDRLLNTLNLMYEPGTQEWAEGVRRLSGAFNLSDEPEPFLLDTVNRWYRGDFIQETAEIGRAGGIPPTGRLVGGYADIGVKPVKDLEDNMRDVVQWAAKEMHDYAASSRGGIKIESMAPNASLTDKPGFIRISEHEPWYREMVASGYPNKKSILSALERIINGTDKGRMDQLYLTRVYLAVTQRVDELARAYPEVANILAGAPETFVQPAKAYSVMSEIPIRDLARALRDRAVFEGATVPPNLFSEMLGGLEIPRQGFTKFFINDLDDMVPRMSFPEDGMEDLWLGMSTDLFSKMEVSALNKFDTRPLKFAGLPPDLQGKLDRYVRHVKGQMNDATVAASNIGGAMRDAALLNYNKQYRWDTALGALAPFAYWFTHSALAWMVHSVDRPAMLSTYLKMQEFMQDALGDHTNMPSRLRGRIRINLPFIPEEMGGVYIDPWRALGSPFGSLFGAMQGLADWQRGSESAAENNLLTLLKNQAITTDEYNLAIANRSGPVWERAFAMAQADEENNRFDALDFMSLTTSPHLPIQWAWNIARGMPAEGFGVLPPTRTVRNILGAIDATGALDVDQVYNNTWGKVRVALGRMVGADFYAFDQWDDYRVDRELSNMVGEGLITVEDMYRAMLERGQNPLFLQASERVERSAGITGLYSILNIPLSAYPEGEQYQRNLSEGYARAWELEESGQVGAVSAFFEQNPEYEARLALFDTPEERMQTFLVDQVWSHYGQLTNLDKQTARAAMGDNFQDYFLAPDPTTGRREYAQIPVEMLGLWLKMLGGDPPGTLGDAALPIRFAAPELSSRTQVFYDYRNINFPLWRELQNEYYDLQGNPERAAFLETHPELEAYWSWADKTLPDWREQIDQYFDLSPDSARDLFLADYPELADFWAQADELFPNHSVLGQQYAQTPDYLKSAFRQAHPELVAYWDWRERTLPHWDMYYDYYFALSKDSQRDTFLLDHPELAQFWATRDEMFPGLTDISKLYNQLPKSDARASFLAENPQLQAYWDWRNQFLYSNPDLVSYLDDEYQPNYGSAEEYEQVQAAQPTFTWDEWSLSMTSPLQEIVIDYIVDGEVLPDAALDELGELAEIYGLTLAELLADLEGAYAGQPVP